MLDNFIDIKKELNECAEKLNEIKNNIESNTVIIKVNDFNINLNIID